MYRFLTNTGATFYRYNNLTNDSDSFNITPTTTENGCILFSS